MLSSGRIGVPGANPADRVPGGKLRQWTTPAGVRPEWGVFTHTHTAKGDFHDERHLRLETVGVVPPDATNVCRAGWFGYPRDRGGSAQRSVAMIWKAAAKNSSWMPAMASRRLVAGPGVVAKSPQRMRRPRRKTGALAMAR